MTEQTPSPAETDNDSGTDTGLGAKPDPVIEPAEPNPGGADAMPETETDVVVGADLPVSLNPAVDQEAHPVLAEGEDTSTEATRDAAATDDTSTDEPPV